MAVGSENAGLSEASTGVASDRSEDEGNGRMNAEVDVEAEDVGREDELRASFAADEAVNTEVPDSDDDDGDGNNDMVDGERML
jgi:hypothetical protein